MSYSNSSSTALRIGIILNERFGGEVVRDVRRVRLGSRWVWEVDVLDATFQFRSYQMVKRGYSQQVMWATRA